jgi:hypothetical protein
MPREATHKGAFATEKRADAEAPLIVALYFEGLSLSAIARRMGRPIEYVSRVFHSPQGEVEVLKRKKARASLQDELSDRITYAAQSALDEIINLSQNAESEAVRRLAAKDIVEKSLEIAGVGRSKGNMVQVNIGDEALLAAMNVMREINVSPQQEKIAERMLEV